MILTKHEAATRQTEAAIDALHRGDFDVAITLAGAAEGMFSRSGPHLFQFMRDHPRVKFAQTEWIAILNRERDWLKHNGDQEPMRLERWEAAMMIVRAATKLETWTPKLDEFREWYLANLDSLLGPEDA